MERSKAVSPAHRAHELLERMFGHEASIRVLRDT